MCFCLFACRSNQIDTEFVTKKVWIYDQGYRFGNIDILNLTTTEYFTCRMDTIFLLDTPFAKIVNINKRESKLIIKSFLTDSIGIYYDINVY